MPEHEEHVARIVERLRKDHPDPAMRTALYAEPGRMTEYVRTLMNGQDSDESEIARIAKAVQGADDGQPG